MNFLVIFIIPWVSISLTERNNCSFPAGLNEFFLNSGPKGLITMFCSFPMSHSLTVPTFSDQSITFHPQEAIPSADKSQSRSLRCPTNRNPDISVVFPDIFHQSGAGNQCPSIHNLSLHTLPKNFVRDAQIKGKYSTPLEKGESMTGLHKTGLYTSCCNLAEPFQETNLDTSLASPHPKLNSVSSSSCEQLPTITEHIERNGRNTLHQSTQRTNLVQGRTTLNNKQMCQAFTSAAPSSEREACSIHSDKRTPVERERKTRPSSTLASSISNTFIPSHKAIGGRGAHADIRAEKSCSGGMAGVGNHCMEDGRSLAGPSSSTKTPAILERKSGDAILECYSEQTKDQQQLVIIPPPQEFLKSDQ